MTYFTSYAQNFEDVILWRALKHVKNGFYIDVGANDPEVHSVTRAFYERGWYGINIEPLPAFHQRFLQERPRDINLSLAAGAEDGELVLYDVPEVRGWASPDAQVANQYQAMGHAIAELRVPVRRLDAICRDHVDHVDSVDRPIHFLKIDVEGFEEAVLRGMDFTRWRPWIVVVEATLPNSQICNHAQWEHLLTAHGYLFGYFDGLNRYYVAPEHAALLDVIKTPANVFDEFVTVHLVKAWAEAQQARDQRSTALTQAEQMHLQLQEAQTIAAAASEQAEQQTRATQEAFALQQTAQAHSERMAQQAQAATEYARSNAARTQELEQTLLLLQASLSWRITRPLRWSRQQLNHLAHLRHLPQRAWAWLRNRLKQVFLWLVQNPTLRRQLRPRLAQFPALETRLQQHVAEIRQDPQAPGFSPEEAALPESLRVLPESARKIFADLTRHSS